MCLRWDKLSDPRQTREGRNRVISHGSKDGESPEEDVCSHSMLHAYNNTDTPVPTIVLELSISSLGGVFDRYLCSITVPCQDLMKKPRSWRHKWHPASLIQGGRVAIFESNDINSAPLVLLETCFDPMITTDHPGQVSIDAVDVSDTVSGDTDTLGSIPNIIRPTLHHQQQKQFQHRRNFFDDDITSKSSVLTTVLTTRITKTHLLRVRHFGLPLGVPYAPSRFSLVGSRVKAMNAKSVVYFAAVTVICWWMLAFPADLSWRQML